MTTSYETSLKMKELNFPQEGGEYYYNIAFKMLHHKSEMVGVTDYSNLCRAFTLGELVRIMGGDFSIRINPDGFWVEWCEFDHGAPFLNDYINYFNPTSPEEAAAELAIELVKSGVIKFNINQKI